MKDDDIFLISTPENFFKKEYAEFKLENGIYKSEIYTKEYRQDLLADYGLASCVSANQFFGRKYQIEEIKNLLALYAPISLFKYLTIFSNYLNLNNSRLLTKDKLQKNLFEILLRHIQQSGLPTETIDSTELKHQCMMSIDTIHGLMGLCLSIGFFDDCNRKDLSNDAGEFSLAIAALNDHVIGPSTSIEAGSKLFHYENLRTIWFRGPLVTTPSDYRQRIYRFVEIIHDSSLLQNNPKINDYFLAKYGVNLNDFCALIPALSTSGFSKRDFDLPDLNCTPPNTKSYEVLNQFLVNISFSPNEYSDEVKKIEQIHGAEFLSSMQFILLLIKNPFLRMGDGHYLLLGMNLLLRHIELSIDSLVIKSKSDNEELLNMRSARGIGAEKYSKHIIEKCVLKFTDKDEMYFQSPKDKNELGDALILHPEISIIFEIKYRQPPLDHFVPTQEALENFIVWFEKTYLLSKDESFALDGKESRDGALHQLVRDSQRLLSGELRGFKPKRVLPIIVNPIDIVFAVDFHEMIDREIKQKNILQGNNDILAPLILGLGELEYLYGMDLGEKKLSLRKILIEKACHPAGRNTTWSVFLERRGLEHHPLDEIKITFDNLIQRAAKILEL